MTRAFTSADVVQSNSGQVFQIDPGVALSNPAGEGNCGLVVVAAGTEIISPEQWHVAASSGAASNSIQVGVMCRPDLPPADQTWAFANIGAQNTNWVWLAEEWTNVSFAPMQGSAQTTTVTAPASISSGTTASFDAPYVVGIAATFVQSNAATAFGWPTVAFSNGFTETNSLQMGDGTGGFDLRLWVARRYGTLNDTGPWSTTTTFTGDMTSKVAGACLAVFRAENYAGEV